jgi:hypothetical protein
MGDESVRIERIAIRMAEHSTAQRQRLRRTCAIWGRAYKQ